MKTLPLPRGVALLAGLLAGLVLTMPPSVRSQVSAKLQNLAAFHGTPDGAFPDGPLAQGGDGNFYGVTQFGGANGDGTVFKATPTGTITLLYSFTGGDDGAEPVGGLVIGRDGNFYGTTVGGGIVAGGPAPDGTIFQLTPAGALTTLYRFANTRAYPLVQGGDGNFYGVALASQTGRGTGPVFPASVSARTSAVTSAMLDSSVVFKMTPTGGFTTIYSFPSGDQGPYGKLALGNDGNFYGVTHGSSGGTLYRVTPDGVYTFLNDFGFGYSPQSPNAPLVQGADGSFYGTTFAGGIGGDTAFRLDSGGGLATLHVFDGNDGASMRSGLTLGHDGNFYGVTQFGGPNFNPNSDLGYGTIFQMTPAGVVTTLYNFDGNDGLLPDSPLLQASNGLFYGTVPDTYVDRADGYFFALSVSTQPAFFTGQSALTNGVYYLQFPNTDYFGYYTFLTDPHYLYHYDLGYEYVFDAADGRSGVYLYDFASNDFFYTSPTFPFPYLYDFGLKSVLYYYPINFAGRYSSGPRYFYDFSTRQIITK